MGVESAFSVSGWDLFSFLSFFYLNFLKALEDFLQKVKSGSSSCLEGVRVKYVGIKMF